MYRTRNADNIDIHPIQSDLTDKQYKFQIWHFFYQALICVFLFQSLKKENNKETDNIFLKIQF